ncbi:galactosylgalactosylxylosylprotein 3-beta-glucuronosyltransferase S isoform X1 [Drosophila santomea]|uniref:galactosylgalactosylxylosylprotein 3-beta-glucuronosyltransferase S isoform X1 n=1 Tax=Drosophila santomea TaxID=129105 RepID=UPI0019534643|nr:galactosylgalactosylxylosylprotein 3-beta-glucuronosyltransferase S isoform X1 [Drosophila santomea]
MSSAHYQALEPQTSDEDNEDIERRHHQSNSRSCTACATSATTTAHPAHAMVRKGGVARRRCLVPLAAGALFFVAFCYLTLSADTRLALGLGGGAEDSEELSHHGIGKQWSPLMETRPADWLLRYTRHDEPEGEDRAADEEEFQGNLSHRTQEIDDYKWNFKIEEQRSQQIHIRKWHRFKPMIHGMNFRPLNETVHICSESYEDRRQFMQDKPQSEYGQLPVIYFVTPTYPRREQIPELTRLAHTLLHVPRLHWLVADDQEKCNGFMDTLLYRFGIPFTHMVSPMPSKFRNEKPAPRGVANRRAALQWLRQHNLTNGILYFGDDDNTYDLRLFSEIRKTQRVSMFPVGLIADYGVSGPVVRKGKVVAFLDSWVAGRRWPVDMAGFAVSLEYMSQYPYVNMPYKPGYEEDLFLRSIGLQMNLIEPRGNNCTEILVWHTQTKSKKLGMVRLESKYLDDRSNLGALLHNLKLMGVASTTESEGRDALISKNGKEKPHSKILS